jgi:DNA-binding PucR family transcriptional regulator
VTWTTPRPVSPARSIAQDLFAEDATEPWPAITSALEIAARALDADVCALLWRTARNGGITAVVGGPVEPSDSQRAQWLALGQARRRSGFVETSPDGVAIASVRVPGAFGLGALVVRSRAHIPEAKAPHEVLVAASSVVGHLLRRGDPRDDRARAFKALFEIAAQIQAQEANADASLALIVEHARGLLDTDVAWLALVDELGERLRIAASDGTSTAEFMRMQVKVGTGIGGVALRDGRPVAVRDVADYANGMPASVHMALAGEGVRSILCAPMVRDGAMVGALYIGSHRLTDFGEEAASLLSALAAQAAVTIENARLYQALAEKNEMLERSEEIHRLLTDASLAGAGLDSITIELARLVDRDLALVVHDGMPRPMLYSSNPALATPTPIDPDTLADADADSRVAVMASAVELGTLLALGADRLTPLQRRALEHGATVIALELVKDQAAVEVEWRMRGELLEELLRSPAPLSDSVIARAERAGVDLTRPHRLAVLKPADGVSMSSLLDLLRRALRGCGQADGLIARRGDHIVLAVPDDVDGGVAALVRTIQKKASRAGTAFSCGLSRASDTLAAALREAEAALGLAVARDGVFVGYEDLGPLRFLLDAPDTTEMSSLVQELLGPLAQRDSAKGSDLLVTLRVFLECGGHHPSTCERCHIHASTLKYRLSRIATVLGRSLADPSTRFELNLAFELLRVLDMAGEAPFTAA